MMGTDRRSSRPFTAALAAAVLATAAACGDDDPGPSEDQTAHGSFPSETRRAELAVLDGWASPLPGASGTVEITVDDGLTTIDLAVEGMQPDTEYPAHVHSGTCEDDPPGGDHWTSDPDGDPDTPTHLHTYVITDADGRGAMIDTSDLTMDDRALSFVVHATGANPDLQEAGTDRILCGDLEPE